MRVRLIPALSFLVLSLVSPGCNTTPPRLEPWDFGRLEARLADGRSPGSVEDARKALADFAGENAWSGPNGKRLVARVRSSRELSLAELFEFPVAARRLRLEVQARLEEGDVRLEPSGQRLPLAPGLGSRPSARERGNWLLLTIEEVEGRPTVTGIEPMQPPADPFTDFGDESGRFLPSGGEIAPPEAT